jgi:hypothetical protein
LTADVLEQVTLLVCQPLGGIGLGVAIDLDLGSDYS